MARRADPRRIDAAHREATRRRLMGLGISSDRAGEWIARWEGQAASDGLEPGADYWEAAWAWVSLQLDRPRNEPGRAARE
jgi:hypothetical protein